MEKIMRFTFKIFRFLIVILFSLTCSLQAQEEPGLDVSKNDVAEFGDSPGDKAREWLEKELFKDDLSTVPGAANFILINVGGNEKAAQIAKELLSKNIVIKGGFRDACLKPYIRVGLGTLEHMRIFLEKFRKVLRDLA